MLKNILTELLKIADFEIVSTAELKKYTRYKRLWVKNKVRADKTKYLYHILKPILEKIEAKNVDAINLYLEECVPFRNLFVNFSGK